ncbi:hypothetical protein [Micromonospora sp. NPDC049274]|uniref:hypothetical protein n=1 Tax=Micromonospora sp. NPDC049274 TaxID=3154829 RepID=UPI0034414D25
MGAVVRDMTEAITAPVNEAEACHLLKARLLRLWRSGLVSREATSFAAAAESTRAGWRVR